MLVLLPLFILSFTYILTIVYKLIKHKKIGCYIHIIYVTIALFLIMQVHIATLHGMYDFRCNYFKMLHCTQYTPIQDVLPSKLDGCIIVYYKFGCPDCEAIYNEVKETVDNDKKIYWVSSRSKKGKQLIKEHKITEVPTGVYVSSTGKYYVQKSLYTNGKYNKKNMKRLLTLKKKNK